MDIEVCSRYVVIDFISAEGAVLISLPISRWQLIWHAKIRVTSRERYIRLGKSRSSRLYLERGLKPTSAARISVSPLSMRYINKIRELLVRFLRVFIHKPAVYSRQSEISSEARRSRAISLISPRNTLAVAYRECNVVWLASREYIFAERTDRIADSYREPLEKPRSRFRKTPRVTCDSPRSTRGTRFDRENCGRRSNAIAPRGNI